MKFEDIVREATLEYWEDIVEVTKHPEGNWDRRVTVGRKRMRCKVRVTVGINGIFFEMGKKACLSKGGKSRDGWITVKKIGKAEEIGREMKQ